MSQRRTARAIEAYNQGNALCRAGQFQQAIAAFRRAIDLDPRDADFHNNLGMANLSLRDYPAAITAFDAARRLRPEWTVAQFNLGHALEKSGQPEAAIAVHRAAAALDPELAYYNLGELSRRAGRLAEAVEYFRIVLHHRPRHALALHTIGLIQLERGEVDAAQESFRRAAELAPQDPVIAGNVPYSMLFRGGASRSQIAEEHRRWAQRRADPFTAVPPPAYPNARDPQRRLRIGYVSPDFRFHPVANFIEPILRAHDPAAVETFCYADVTVLDAMSERIRSAVGTWRHTLRWPVEQLYDQVRADRIDVLVDLAGQTAGNRLPLFARRPAPVQVSYLGYPFWLDLRTIDCRISDELVDPPGQPLAEGEHVCRLPRCAWCYAPPDDAPDIAEPSDASGVTFGSFNFLAKVSDPCVALWAGLLREVPGSRLWLKDRTLRDASARDLQHARFARHGIDPSRLEMSGWEPSLRDHLSRYARVDVALDPFPYNGTTTTCEALWMGVPVVTLAGEMPQARVGVSLLSNVGLSDLVAADEADFVRIATTLAADVARRRELRQSLRDRMRASPLMDAARAARGLESIFRTLWQKWCACPEPNIPP